MQVNYLFKKKGKKKKSKLIYTFQLFSMQLIASYGIYYKWMDS